LRWIGMWAGMDSSDSETLLPACAKKLEQNAALLHIGLNDKLLEIYENEEDEEVLFKVIDSIPFILKPWFVVETYMMLSSAGNIGQRAMQITLIYCDKIGISEELYLEIIKEAYKATGDYDDKIAALFDGLT
jgi:hypothetical protein